MKLFDHFENGDVIRFFQYSRNAYVYRLVVDIVYEFEGMMKKVLWFETGNISAAVPSKIEHVELD